MPQMVFQHVLTFKRFEVLDCQAQYSQLVQLARHGVTGGDHARQLIDQIVHLVPPSLLNLTVRLPNDGKELSIQIRIL